MKTYGDLLNALIAHYEWCVENLPEDDIKRSWFLNFHSVDDGICWCSRTKFFYDIESTLFMRKLTNYKTYLCHVPKNKVFDCAIQFLQTRIDRMKEMLPEWGNVEIGV